MKEAKLCKRHNRVSLPEPKGKKGKNRLLSTEKGNEDLKAQIANLSKRYTEMIAAL